MLFCPLFLASSSPPIDFWRSSCAERHDAYSDNMEEYFDGILEYGECMVKPPRSNIISSKSRSCSCRSGSSSSSRNGNSSSVSKVPFLGTSEDDVLTKMILVDMVMMKMMMEVVVMVVSLLVIVVYTTGIYVNPT